MTMGTLLTVLFYLWLAVSGVVATIWYRRRMAQRAEDIREAELLLKHSGNSASEYRASPRSSQPVHPAAAADVGEAAADVGEPADRTQPVEADQTAEVETVPVAVDSLPPGNNVVEASQDTHTEEFPRIEVPFDVPDLEDGETFDGFDTVTTTDTDLDDGHDSNDASDSLFQLLSELDLPYELTPLGHRRRSTDGDHVALVSQHPDAAEVGTALADEMVGHGYEFEPMGHDHGLARRGSDVVALRIVPNAAESDLRERYRLSQLDQGSVVVEMWSEASDPAGTSQVT